MKIKIDDADIAPKPDRAFIVLVPEGAALAGTAARLDEASGGALARALAASPRFTGKKDQLVTLLALSGIDVTRLIIAGFGKAEDVTAARLEDIGGALTAHLNSVGEKSAVIAADSVADLLPNAGEAAAALAYGARLRAYRFDAYRTRQKPEQKPSLERLSIATKDAPAARKRFAQSEKIADGVFFTRDLVSEPPNVLYPESFAEACRDLTKLGVSVEVLDEKALRKLGMGAIIGVGQGSAKPPRLVVLRWDGAKDKDKPPVAFVGKGVTFDTGGISIKPAAGMEDMKWDMAGAGAVVGAIKALAGRKARVNAVGVATLAENMPDGNAQRPGDIVTSLSGQTIEVINTDAEGRLVLADALWYTQDRFKPSLMIDLATLTGAIIVALGHQNAGLFSNNDELAERLQAAGKAVGETLWRMPLGEAFDREIDSEAADMRNIARNREAGSTIGAVFLQRFVRDLPWAHLDIAGVAWSNKDKGTVPKGATAFGVRLLDRLVADYYED